MLCTTHWQQASKFPALWCFERKINASIDLPLCIIIIIIIIIIMNVLLYNNKRDSTPILQANAMRPLQDWASGTKRWPRQGRTLTQRW